jgi:uncharacterized protein (DUF608 family)
MTEPRSPRLFPIDIPERQIAAFDAQGFAQPVAGIRFTSDRPPYRGVPLGGLGTGCIDLDANGTLGQCSAFNSFVPRRGRLNLPFLGLSVGYLTWQLSTLPIQGFFTGEFFRPADPIQKTYLPLAPRRIHYWGHYPIADLEYELDCPVSVGLRAWSPFIPGDTVASNTPGAVFEINLRNTTGAPQQGKLVLSFPGPSAEETYGDLAFQRRQVQGGFSGAVVTNASGAGYALGVVWKDNNSYDLKGIGADATVRVGGELGIDGGAWAHVGIKGANSFSMWARDLPENVNQPGASVSVDYRLEPGEAKVIRYVLAWYAPEWKAGGRPCADGNSFYHKYAERYRGPREVAEYLAQNHELLLKRIIGWQQVIYGESALPDYLRDYLINILYLLPETSYWAQARPPIGKWCQEEDGLFCIDSCYTHYPITGSISDSYTSEFPLAFFFPDLLRSTIRTYKAYQFPSGAACWSFGGLTNRTPVCELTMPTPGYQTVLNGVWLAAAVDRLWNATGDNRVVPEFYEMIKKNVVFTMGLNRGPDGVASMPDRIVSAEFPVGDRETEWYEMNHWFGIVPHIGGLHLAQLHIALRMAQMLGDGEFAAQCEDWISQAHTSIENKMWEGDHYTGYLDEQAGLKSDFVFTYTLDGEALAALESLPTLFDPARKRIMLETIKRLCLKEDWITPLLYVSKDGRPVKSGADKDSEVSWSYDEYFMCFYSTIFLLINLIQQGDRELALEITRRYCSTINCTLGFPWSIPEHTEGRAMTPYFFDDTHHLFVWSLPALLLDGDVRRTCSPGGFIYRIRQGGKDQMVRASE